MKHEPSKPEDHEIAHEDLGKAKRILGYSPTHTFEETAKFAEWKIGKSRDLGS